MTQQPHPTIFWPYNQRLLNSPERIEIEYPILCHETKQTVYTSENEGTYMLRTVLVPAKKRLVVVSEDVLRKLEQQQNAMQFQVSLGKCSESDTQDLANLVLAIKEGHFNGIEPSKNDSRSGVKPKRRGSKRYIGYYQKGFSVVKFDISVKLNESVELQIVTKRKKNPNGFMLFRSRLSKRYYEKYPGTKAEKVSVIASNCWRKNDELRSTFKDLADKIKELCEKKASAKQTDESSTSDQESSAEQANHLSTPDQESSAEQANWLSAPDQGSSSKKRKRDPEEDIDEMVEKVLMDHITPNVDSNQAESNTNATHAVPPSHTVENAPFDFDVGAGNAVTPSAASNQGGSSTMPLDIDEFINGLTSPPTYQAQQPQTANLLQAQQQPMYNVFTTPPITSAALVSQENDWSTLGQPPMFPNQGNISSPLGNSAASIFLQENSNTAVNNSASLLVSQHSPANNFAPANIPFNDWLDSLNDRTNLGNS
ncbi:hypothetical protein BX667DRAFT_506901 [Coemansia mojavensis]|nr:hypothetical protein BX667DRAFT_506901 [Coemansia mojavensis]